jgi:glutaminyl-tRNA synthetase
LCQTADEIKEFREKKQDSPWRNRPIKESLKLFDDMRRGLIDEGNATLRMKQDMKNDNFNMYDLIAYRIKFARHPQVGDKWCIYPSYDFTHCIVDALENITHSVSIGYSLLPATVFFWFEVNRQKEPYVR